MTSMKNRIGLLQRIWTSWLSVLEYEQLHLLKGFIRMVNLLSQENLLSANFLQDIDKLLEQFSKLEKSPLQEDSSATYLKMS